jgi:flagellar basal body rod protein FlgB
MLNGLIGEGSAAAQLKEGLTASSRAVRGIAHRVANASTPDFAEALDSATAAGEAGAVDLEKEMVALADEQLRFETAASLLQKVYQQVRASIRER